MSPITSFCDKAVVKTRLYIDDQRKRAVRRHDERGSVTIEQVLWAVAMIAIVGIVVLAITNFVTTKAGEIR
ncbi:MAG: hypothetical protein GX440_06770 [Propionibacterium sp.]|nr:hypothetical protein [Propionibacterium sp.]